MKEKRREENKVLSYVPRLLVMNSMSLMSRRVYVRGLISGFVEIKFGVGGSLMSESLEEEEEEEEWDFLSKQLHSTR
jgi:hypothetical protein